MAVNAAGDDRDDAAARANMELRGPRAEFVPGCERWILDDYLQSSARVGSPHAAMFRAKAAAAGPCLDFRRIGEPGERE